MYKWTVNWKLLPEDVFLDRRFAAGLLAVHLILLGLFVCHRWLRPYGGVLCVAQNFCRSPKPIAIQRPDTMVSVVLTSNFIGIALARSLHYQFYSWYCQSLPFLLWQTAVPVGLKLVLLFAIEACWNTFPATALSSAVLTACHIALLALLWVGRPPQNKRAD
jgi:alpha-1,3-mannosyltransferase